MKIRTSKIGAVLSALLVMGVSGVASASSHREAPSISDDPAADNTDTYAWVDSSTQNLIVVANYIGLELPEGGPNWAKFSDDVLYEVHIARGGKSLADALTYQIQFKTKRFCLESGDPGDGCIKYSDPTKPNAVPAGGQEFFTQLTGTGAFGQTYTVKKYTNGKKEEIVAKDVPVPPPNVGPETNTVAYAIPQGTDYEGFFAAKSIGTLTSGGKADGRVFAGPRDDPFFVDLGGIFDLAQIRPVANPAEPARDSIQYMNVHSIVLEIPLATAAGGVAIQQGKAIAAQTVGVWASASRRKTTVLRRDGLDEHYGPWRQVSRLGLPLVNEAIIGLQDKDLWNRLTPADDFPDFLGYFDNPVAVRDAEAIGFYGAGGPLAGCAVNGKGPESGRVADIAPVITLAITGHTGAEAIGPGDVIRLDLGQPNGFPNGRLLTDDVVDVELQLLLCTLAKGGPIPDGPTANEATFNPKFPYLLPPWEGRSANPRPINSLP